MNDEAREYESAVEARVTAEFGCPEPDAERVAAAAGRLRRDEDVDWNPSFLVEKLADAPRDHSVPEKWNWWLDYYGKYAVDMTEYEVADSSTGNPTTDAPTTDDSNSDDSGSDDSDSDSSDSGGPTTDTASTDDSTTDAPTTDDSTTDNPSTGNPTTDDSAIDDPPTDDSSEDG